jgi:hypothetical protein
MRELGNWIRRVELEDEVQSARVRALAEDLAETLWQPAPGLQVVPYIDGTPVGTPRRADVLWIGRKLYVEQLSKAKLAKRVPEEIGKAFGRVEIRAALDYGFERSAEDVRAYLVENFKLAAIEERPIEEGPPPSASPQGRGAGCGAWSRCSTPGGDGNRRGLRSSSKSPCRWRRINKASAREKSIRHGHPHPAPVVGAAAAGGGAGGDLRADGGRPLGAPRPLPHGEGPGEGAPAAVPDHRGAGAVGEHHQRGGAAAGARRDLAELARTCAENADHPRAKKLFDRNKLPAFHDPFAGGGALPLEAQRLGLEAYASDLNPVAVLINKAMIEIPPKFAGKPPVNPDAQEKDLADRREWKGRAGPGRGRALLRQVDARRGREAHRPPLPEGRGHGRDGEGAARPEAVRRPEAHRDRLALGAHGEEPEPGLRAGGRAAGLDLHALHQGWARRPTSSR